MARRLRPRSSPWWRRALDVDRDLADVEGLAAGTGLLTGDLARAGQAPPQPCPRCSRATEVVVIDLVAQQVSRRCSTCGHRWQQAEAVPGRSAP